MLYILLHILSDYMCIVLYIAKVRTIRIVWRKSKYRFARNGQHIECARYLGARANEIKHTSQKKGFPHMNIYIKHTELSPYLSNLCQRSAKRMYTRQGVDSVQYIMWILYTYICIYGVDALYLSPSIYT